MMANRKNAANEQGVHVFNKAQVLGQAEVSQSAMIKDHAIIADHAKAYGFAVLQDYCRVFDSARVYGESLLTTHAQIGNTSHCQNATLSGNSYVLGKSSIISASIADHAGIWDSRIWDGAKVGGSAQVKDSLVRGRVQINGDAQVTKSEITGNAVITGRAVVKDARIGGNARIGGSAIILGGTWDGSEGEILKGTWMAPGELDFNSARVQHILDRIAGEFQPPPAMVKTISKWLVEVCSAHIWADIEPQIAVARDPVLGMQRHIDQNNAVLSKVNLMSLAIGETFLFDIYTVRGSNQEVQIDKWGIQRKNLYGFVFGQGKNEGRLTWNQDKLPYAFLGTQDPQKAESLINGIVKEANQKLQQEMTNPRYNIVDLSMLVKELKRWATKPKFNTRSVTKSFPVDLTGWRYNKPEDKTPEEVGFGEINVSLDFSGKMRAPNSLGHWRASTRELVIVPQSFNLTKVSDYVEGIRGMLDTLSHELRHVGQTALAAIRGSTDSHYGLPSRRIRNLEYNPNGIQPSPDSKGNALQKDHALRDVEFYTRLSDEVGDFDRAYRKIPTAQLSEALKVWVGESSADKLQLGDFKVERRKFFWMLKTKEPLKWKKAVAEFYKAVAERGLVSRVASQWLTTNQQYSPEDV